MGRFATVSGRLFGWQRRNQGIKGKVMDAVSPIVWLWQRVPSSWRRGLVKARFAPRLRSLVNRLYPDSLAVFDLAEPLGGHRMRLHWQTQKAYVFGTHETEVTEAVRTAVQPGQVALDLGANIGYHTLLLAQQVGPLGKVIAFEPLPGVFKVLQENIALNGYRNVVLENKAVASCSGPVNLKINDADPLTSTVSIVSGGGIEIQAVSLDDYFAESGEKVAFVKMDVEHAEAQVIEGMERLLRKDRPIMLIELHAFSILGDRHPALLRIEDAGYSVSFLDAPGVQVHILALPDA
jgi:FkbM family methyltransferase